MVILIDVTLFGTFYESDLKILDNYLNVFFLLLKFVNVLIAFYGKEESE